MGSGYSWQQAPQGPGETQFQSYLSSQIGQQGPKFEGGQVGMPDVLMDVGGIWSQLLGGAGRGGVGTTGEGFPMPSTGAFPGMGFLGTAQGGLEKMLAEGGMPTTGAGYTEALKKQYSQDLQDQINQLLEQRTASGRGRYGTGASRAVAEATGRSALAFGTEAERFRLSSEEAAKQRLMNVFNLAPGFAQTQAGIPQSFLTGATQFGQGQWQIQQQQQQEEYNRWLQQQYGYTPQFGAAQGAFGQPAQQVAAPSPWLSVLSGLLQGGGSALGGYLGGG